MKESIGYTVSLNIVITFIIIIITFLCSALIYFKSNKVSNVITETIEKYEGYNTEAINEITMKLSSLGYNEKEIKCDKTVESSYINKATCPLLDNGPGDGKNGYCVYICEESEKKVNSNISSSGNNTTYYYYYKIKTNMMLNIPIINDILDIPIFSNTNRLYDFEENLKNK